MAYIQDRHSQQYWKKYGDGSTPNIEQAYDFSSGQAQAMLRIFWDSVVVLEQKETSRGPEWVEYSHAPDPKASPIRTKDMKDRGLVWVRYDGVWMATDIQSLIMGTLLAIRGEPAQQGLVA